MKTVHQILLLGAALLWAAGHARAAVPLAAAAAAPVAHLATAAAS
jgi:hypothetical protein